MSANLFISIVFSVLLFCAGVAFAFYVGFPMIIQFALKLSLTLNISPVIGFKAYLIELIRWLFTFGILFQYQYYLWVLQNSVL